MDKELGKIRKKYTSTKVLSGNCSPGGLRSNAGAKGRAGAGGRPAPSDRRRLTRLCGWLLLQHMTSANTCGSCCTRACWDTTSTSGTSRQWTSSRPPSERWVVREGNFAGLPLAIRSEPPVVPPALYVPCTAPAAAEKQLGPCGRGEGPVTPRPTRPATRPPTLPPLPPSASPTYPLLQLCGEAGGLCGLLHLP